MRTNKKETELQPCAFNHPDCYSCSHGICRLLGDMEFHGKDCSFYATKEQVREGRQKVRERLISIGADHLLNYPEHKRGKENEHKQEKH